MALKNHETKRYLTISDGLLREKGVQGEEGVKPRVVEMSDGTTKTLWETTYRAISGYIKKMQHKTHKQYGTKLEIDIDSEGEIFTIQINDQSRYYMDFLSKLPNIDLSKEVELTPYAIEKDGNTNAGISIKQNDEKIGTYYKSFHENKDGTTSVTCINGYPEYKGKKNDKDRFKLYIGECRLFLKEDTAQIMLDLNQGKIGGNNDFEL